MVHDEFAMCLVRKNVNFQRLQDSNRAPLNSDLPLQFTCILILKKKLFKYYVDYLGTYYIIGQIFQVSFINYTSIELLTFESQSWLR